MVDRWLFVCPSCPPRSVELWILCANSRGTERLVDDDGVSVPNAEGLLRSGNRPNNRIMLARGYGGCDPQQLSRTTVPVLYVTRQIRLSAVCSRAIRAVSATGDCGQSGRAVPYA